MPDNALIRCENGHFYAPAQHRSCPYCGVDLSANATRPKRDTPPAAPPSPDDARTVPAGGASSGSAARPAASTPSDDAKTVRLGKATKGIDPVVGWLVCVAGPDRGRDYRIREGRNWIGRGEHMEVCIRGDQTIHREHHAGLAFEPRRATYTLLPGDQNGLVYLNGDAVYVPTPVSRGDTVELGKTRLRFVPLCDDGFRWEGDQE